MMSRNRLIKISGTGLLFVASFHTHASGFALLEQSASAQGNAYAGAASAGQDAATIAYNPAAMTSLSKGQVVMSLQSVMPSMDFLDAGSSSSGVALTGGNSESSESILAPSFYATYPLTNDLVAGFGISTPFGFNSEYDATWTGRYHAIHSELKTMNLSPALAYRVRDKLSLGLGINIIKSDVDLSNAMDFGLLTTGTQTDDGLMSYSGDSWDYGFNVGALWEPGAGTKVGLNYRSRVTQEIGGTVNYSASSTAAAAATAAGFVSSGATTELALPDSLTLSIFSKGSESWDFMFDTSWTGWDYKGLAIKPSIGNDLVTDENWDFAVRLALGTNYHFNDKLTLKAGLAWDQSPVQNYSFRSARVPDSDQRTLALGVAYNLSSALKLDGGYSYINIPDGYTTSTDAYGHQLLGHFENSTHLLGAQFTWTFE